MRQTAHLRSIDPLNGDKNSARDKYTSRHCSDSLYRRIGEGSYGKSVRRKTSLGNIKQWMYFPQMEFTFSTRPAIDLDLGQISAGSGTSLNYDKVKRSLCSWWTNNASAINDIAYHHCYVETRPTRVICALTTVFVMAGRQGLRKKCTRLHTNWLE